MEGYFTLDDRSDRAVKEADHRIQEGGPAICRVEIEKRIDGELPGNCRFTAPFHGFTSSYVPLRPVHDTDFHAACTARILRETGDSGDFYSCWTFGDVFEEADVPKPQFHWGFGFAAPGGIKKPIFFAFKFFRRSSRGTAVPG